MTIEDVKARLETLGYSAQTSDDELINFILTKVTNNIKNDANITEIPSSVANAVTDIIVGEFLHNKKSVGADLSGINLEVVANSMNIGDTQIDFGKDKTDQEFNNLISGMINNNYNNIVSSLRRFKW